jgi:hypothetical protein
MGILSGGADKRHGAIFAAAADSVTLPKQYGV